MSLVLFHTRKVRNALMRPAQWGTELAFLGAVAALIGLILIFAREAAAPYRPALDVNLSVWALPKYTLLSLSRGFAAYILSLTFTLVYGTIAAHNERAEKLMIPALDVLQAIPVLGFLPGLVLAMVQLFPTTELGLELACVVMIFTGQAWNMTFSFHGSLRSIPTALREVATLQKLSAWRTFRLLELPAATIGLVWNSMMSMAGGWFFLTVCEAFTLSEKDYRLPGLGSYMSEAINKDDNTAKIAGVIAMTIMIVAVDQLFWRPIVVWSERFKVEDQASSDPPESWMLNILQRSKLYGWLLKNFKRRRDHETIPMFKWLLAKSAVVVPEEAREKAAPHFAKAMRLGVAVALIALAFWGAYTLVGLLIKLPLHEAEGEDWIHVFLALAATFLRVSAAMILGTAWALPVGIMIGLSPRWSQRLQPIIQFCASFPAPMIFPMVVTVVYFLHIPFTFGCVALMLLGTQWYILFNVIAGAMAIPQELKEVTTIYRCSKWQRWTKLYLPNVTPYLLTGLVTAAGGAWNASIVSEYLVLKGETTMAFGLGSMISQATAKGNLSLLAAAVTTMAIFVVLVNRFFWKRLYRIAENRFSMNV